MKAEVLALKGQYEKSATFIRKEFEAGELKRSDKAEKANLALDKEFKLKLDDFTAMTSARIKALETDNKTMSKGLAEITGQLKDKFDEIIAAKTDDFELSMEETTEKAEKARSDVKALAEGLKGKFQAGEAERRKETDKYLKELMILKGEMTKRMKDVDASINAFAGIRNSLKNEIIKENTVMVDSKLASLNENKKRDIVDSKASLKTEIDEMHVFVSKAVEKVGRLSEKIDGMKEDIYTVKKARTLVLDDVKSLGRTLDENNMVRMNNFLKEMEKRLRTQEQIIGARMADVEKKIGAVSEHASRTKKEKEAELDELLKHVES
jgi:hypothetical protein